MNETYRDIVYEVEDPIAVIKMNRPEALNAFTARMLAEIKHALAEAESDERVVGIVLTGEGKGFCPGMDMNALDSQSNGTNDGQREDLSFLAANPGDETLGGNFETTYTYLMSIRKPIISAINGACAGLGLAVATMTDIRIAERSAKFSTAFAQRGLIAEHGISWTLPRLVGTGNALDLLWSARKFDGKEAKDLGLAEILAEDGESLVTAKNYIKKLAMGSAPKSLQVIKAQVHRHNNMQLGESMKETNDWMAISLKRSDFKEGVRSFIEKRPPNFERVNVT